MQKLKWKTETRPIASLVPADWNPRYITAKRACELTESLDTFGLVVPLAVNTDGLLIGGHQRLAILKTKGIAEVEVRVPNRPLTEAEVQELNLRLNKNTGEFDWDKLANLDEELLLWLIEKALANSSSRGWGILDPFGGSGSTLIACHRLKRKCYTMEFDPRFVDVIIERWERYTKMTAEKVKS